MLADPKTLASRAYSQRGMIHRSPPVGSDRGETIDCLQQLHRARFARLIALSEGIALQTNEGPWLE
jgi:hypothetical protein